MLMHRVNERLNVMHMEYEKKGSVINKQVIARALPGIYAGDAGIKDEHKTFSDVFDEYIEDQKRQVGKTISAGTFGVRSRYRKLYENILVALNLVTQPLVNYTDEDVREVQLHFLGTHARGTVTRAMYVFSCVFEYAIRKNLIDKNPCKVVKKVKMEEDTDLVWLEPEELGALTEQSLSGREEEVRDAFVFCCWTGLAVGDYILMDPNTQKKQIEIAQSARSMEPAVITKTKDGLMLCGKRRKSGTRFRVPLLPEAQRIIGKYGGVANLPYNLNANGTILNLLMRLIKVEKKIRFHTARKTFANYLLNERMINPVYTIEMMGWKRIEEANPYVRIKESSLYKALAGLSTPPSEH